MYLQKTIRNLHVYNSINSMNKQWTEFWAEYSYLDQTGVVKFEAKKYIEQIAIGAVWSKYFDAEFISISHEDVQILNFGIVE